MTPMFDDSDAAMELLQRWRNGDRLALDQLIADLQPWLHREMSKALAAGPRVSQDSMDLAQTAIANFLSWGPKFVPQNAAQLRGLFLRIAKNELIDRERRLSRIGHRKHAESLDGSSLMAGFGASRSSSQQPSAAASRSEDTEWVRLALQFLEPDERYLLLASEVDGLDWPTIASELGLDSADAARMRAARLKPRLARLLLQIRGGRIPAET